MARRLVTTALLVMIVALNVLTSRAWAVLSVTTTATPTFSVTLNGSDQAPTYSLPLDVTDSSGLGAGWNVTTTSTQLTTSGTPSHTLSANASSLTSRTS
jgi:hypothetical protein